MLGCLSLKAQENWRDLAFDAKKTRMGIGYNTHALQAYERLAAAINTAKSFEKDLRRNPLYQGYYLILLIRSI